MKVFREKRTKRTTRKSTIQEGVFLNFLSPSMTVGLPLMKNVLTVLAKNIFFSFELSARMSAADVAIQKNG